MSTVMPLQTNRSRKSTPTTLAMLLLTAGLAACGSSPQVRLYQLRLDPPAGAFTHSQTPISSGPRWAVGPVSLPDYLDRDAMIRPVQRSGLSANSQQRWAEPLRDAVPRLLIHDLGRLRGSEQVWRAPAPAGAGTERTLRVEVLRLDAREDGRAVVVQARWTLLDPTGRTPAKVRESRLEAPCDDDSTDALATAHRSALWLLAQDIAHRADLP